MQALWTRMAALMSAAILLSACASAQKQAFYYPEPSRSAPAPGRVSVVLEPTRDARSGDKTIDQAYELNPVEGIPKALETELLASGAAGPVDIAQSGEPSQLATYRIATELLTMQWEVPDYESKIRKIFWISLLTGGLGGVIYGNTKTDVHGRLSLRVEVIAPSDTVALDEIYRGESADRMTLLGSETKETKARMIGLALKDALKVFIDDFRKVASAERPAFDAREER